MFAGRDLVSEKATTGVAAQVPQAAAGSKRKQMTHKETFDAAVGLSSTLVSEGYAMVLDDSCCDHLMAQLSEQDLKMAQALPGIYWLIGEVDCKPAFKQEKTADDNAPNSYELLLFWYGGHEKGWYIAKEFFENNDDYNTAQNGSVVFAWCGQSDAPEKVHIPYWTKKATTGAAIISATRFLMQRMHCNL